MLIFLLFTLYVGSIDATIFDCLTGRPVTRRKLQLYTERNNTRYCVNSLKLPCDETAWRREDGSCNYLRQPSRGMWKTPTERILPPDFKPNTKYDVRDAKSGKTLPLARNVRYRLLMEGKANDLDLTQLVTFYLLFAFNDINSFHDILNYVVNTTTCCQPEGKLNYICSPNEIPVDDAVHRYSGLRCMNLTRPQTFQYFGCADFYTTRFARITFTTPTYDLSTSYGNLPDYIPKLRAYKKGLLKVEIENGKIFPPKNPEVATLETNLCVLNELPEETRCHRYQSNGALGPNLLTIVFYRLHNYFANKLAELNPCWSDDRLFFTARDINIAVHMQIYLYELLPVLFGRRNMIEDGIISSSGGFRDLYKSKAPVLTDEYVYIQRWFHTVQETELKLYDTDGYFLKSFPLVNLTARTGYLPLRNNIEEIFQASFRQYCGKFDFTIDNDMSERILGGLQFSSDASANHILKGRLFGFPPYVKYKEFFYNRPYKTFDSLEEFISKERIYRLKELYENVEDVELLAGAWAENRKPRARVPDILYSLMTWQLKRVLESDRHWYERPNRPHAFCEKQLQAIRKASIAGVLCNTAEGVTRIQPKAFYSISPNNPLTSCKSSKIGKVDLSPWKDESCTA